MAETMKKTTVIEWAWYDIGEGDFVTGPRLTDYVDMSDLLPPESLVLTPDDCLPAGKWTITVEFTPAD